MGLFSASPQEHEKIRGVKDAQLPGLSDERLMMLAMARLYEAMGIDDNVLVSELYRRARNREGVICGLCNGSGLDRQHRWPDGSYASCEKCEGYGSIVL